MKCIIHTLYILKPLFLNKKPQNIVFYKYSRYQIERTIMKSEKIDTKKTLWDAKKALADAQEPFLNREKILIAGTNAFQDAEKELLNAKKALADAERATISQRKEVLAAYEDFAISDFKCRSSDLN